MELQVSQDVLVKSLSSVGRVTTSRAGLPILNNILLRTSGDSLVIAATNLEIASAHSVNAKIIKPGSITIPAKLITEFVQNLPKGDITLKLTNNRLHISTGKFESRINGTPDDEFPELPIVDKQNCVSYTLTTDDIKSTIGQTVICASSDNTRPVLTGAFLHSYENKLLVAATDGYRLAERYVVDTKSDISVIIPVTTLQEVARSLTDDVQEVDIEIDDSLATFTVSDSTITSRLIDGKFPDYRQLIPEKSTTTCVVAREELARIVKLASIFSRDTGGGITMHVDTESNTIKLHSVATELGENTSEVSAKTNGETASISLNSRYIIDALSVMPAAKNIKIGFSGKLSPCVLKDNEITTSYTHIIMPLKS